MDDITKPPKRIRPPKTETQKQAGAASSARNREKNRLAGVPSAAVIDTAIANVFIRKMYSKGGISVNAERTKDLIGYLARRGGWDIKNDAVRKAIEHRVETHRLRTLPSSSVPVGNGLQK